MTKEPPADAVPPVEPYRPLPPPDDTMPAPETRGQGRPGSAPKEGGAGIGDGNPTGTGDRTGPGSGAVAGAGNGNGADGAETGEGADDGNNAGEGVDDGNRAGDASAPDGRPWPGLAAEDQGWLNPAPPNQPWASSPDPAPANQAWAPPADPAELETVAAAGAGRPVRIGRGTGRVSKRLITAYFAGGLALLLAGTVAVFYLAFKVYGSEPGTTVAAPRGYPSPSRPASRPPTAGSVSPGPVRPSVPLRARFGPQQLANGQSFVVRGEGDARFRLTVKAGKFRKSGCDPYAVKPEEGGYLPVELKLKVLQGEPEVSEYAFRFQKPDGEWLPSVGGSGCDGRNYGGFFRRLSAGRTYTSSVVFDVPGAKGDIVFVYPLMDVVAAWKVK